MASPQVRTVEYDLSQRVPSYPGMYGLIIGAFDKGPINQRTWITTPQQADLVLGKPKVGSDVAYFILHTFLTKSKRCWCVRVSNGALYGGVSVGASFYADGILANGVQKTYTVTLPYERCHYNTVSVYVDRDRVAFDEGEGNIVGVKVSGTVDYETGVVTAVFDEAPAAKSTVLIGWGLPNKPFTTGLANPTEYDFNSRTISQVLKPLSKFEPSALDTRVCLDTVVPYPLVDPVNVVGSQLTSTFLVYDEGNIVAYADETGQLHDVLDDLGEPVGFLDPLYDNEITYINGNLQFKIYDNYNISIKDFNIDVPIVERTHRGAMPHPIVRPVLSLDVITGVEDVAINAIQTLADDDRTIDLTGLDVVYKGQYIVYIGDDEFSVISGTAGETLADIADALATEIDESTKYTATNTNNVITISAGAGLDIIAVQAYIDPVYVPGLDEVTISAKGNDATDSRTITLTGVTPLVSAQYLVTITTTNGTKTFEFAATEPNITHVALGLSNLINYDTEFVSASNVGVITITDGAGLADITVVAEKDSTIPSTFIYDGLTKVAYVDGLGQILDFNNSGFLDPTTTATNKLNYTTGNLEFKIKLNYVYSKDIIVTGKYYSDHVISVVVNSHAAESMIIYGDNPGDWTNSYYTIVDRVNPITREFNVTVYEEDSRTFKYIVDQYSLSRGYKIDGYGNQMFVEERVNGKSYYIRIRNNPYLEDDEAVPTESYVHENVSVRTPVKLEAGYRGTTPSVAEYIQQLQTFNNKEDVKVDIIVDTLGDENYQLEIAKLCDRELGGRADCYGILYAPFELEQSNNYANDLVSYRKYSINLTSSFVGLYAGHVKVYDAYNGREIWIPCSGFVAAAFSFTADQFEPWFPAAGWRRGVLPVRDVYRRFTLGERDLLYDNDINVIRFRPGKGIAIWGQKTLYGRPSALDRANVRWLLIVIENAIEEFLEEYEFEINDQFTRASAKSAVHSYLKSIKIRRGLYDYDVVCDDTNNTPEEIDNYKMYLDYYVQPTKAAEYIYGRAIITRTGVRFEDVRITG